MNHRWLLKELCNHFQVTKIVFRYNYGNMTKFDLSDVGHHIECSLKEKGKPDSYTTKVYIGPYNNLDDAQADMEFMKNKKD